ncbi:MAG: peptide chain release factor N(5)-glutamine methyltransferase [Cocleimonas sp.]|nr:peptide chain release factor N(5)-glutamine methyltransferase [Cocleimonas sp.]
MTTIQALLKQTSRQLASVSESPQLDAELLLAHCLHKERSYLYAWGEKQVEESTQQAFKQLIKKRLTDYPVAYLLGYKEFWSLDLMVTEDVLIPRPETELVVETALEKIQSISTPNILDLGTGTGAIALAIASERPDALITASDYSENALAIAKKNAHQNQINTVDFIPSDWFTNLPRTKFDLIVSNPPYIKSDDLHLQQGIRYEPLQALAAGKTGLDDIISILDSALAYMKNGAWIIIEHGYDQGKLVPMLMKNAGLQQIRCIQDYNENDRLTMGKKYDNYVRY